jgi:hypothetical protein
MRLIIILLIIISTVINAQQHGEEEALINKNIPFPQCFKNDRAASFFKSNVIEHIFEMKLEEEEKKLMQERDRNIHLNNGMYSNDIYLVIFRIELR